MKRVLGLNRWDAIIFDLGGVLLNLDYSATTRAFSRLAGRELRGLYSKTEQASLFDRFERGEISVAAFRNQLRRALGVPCEDADLDAAWNALLLDVPRENIELLLQLRQSHRVYLLSNTNELHITDFVGRFEREHGATYGSWSSLFHKDYYSHQVGLRKPDAAVFQHVLEAEGLQGKRTLFIDDNWHNVLGARSAGLEAAWIDVPADRGPAPSSAHRELHPELDGARNLQELFSRCSP
jgi:glucose-1-phosphatase